MPQNSRLKTPTDTDWSRTNHHVSFTSDLAKKVMAKDSRSEGRAEAEPVSKVRALICWP